MSMTVSGVQEYQTQGMGKEVNCCRAIELHSF